MTVKEAREKLIALARSEVGYHETGDNWTKYAADPQITRLYGWNVQNQPWCCTFVNWCFLTAFGYDIGSRLTYGGTAACSSSADLFKKNGAFKQTPEIGDQVFFYSGGGINHTGIVIEVNGSSIKTVEGNYSDKVGIGTYILGSSILAGFGRPQWDLVLEDWEKPWVVSAGGQIVNSSDRPQEDPQESPQETGGKVATVTASDSVSHKWTPPLLSYDPNIFKDAVTVLQGILNCRNFDAGKVDGGFGPNTQAAVNRARLWYGLQATGDCDAALWAELLKIENDGRS